MLTRSLPLILTAVLLSGCTKHVRTSSHISIADPAQGPGGSATGNALTLSYEVETPEEVYLIADGKRAHTATLTGKGSWRIEAAGGKLRVTGPGISHEMPLAVEGAISSEMTGNNAGQLVFDVSVDGKKVMQVECPSRPAAKPAA